MTDRPDLPNGWLSTIASYAHDNGRRRRGNQIWNNSAAAAAVFLKENPKSLAFSVQPLERLEWRSSSMLRFAFRVKHLAYILQCVRICHSGFFCLVV